MRMKEDLPVPSPLAEGQVLIRLPVRVVAKLALYMAIKERVSAKPSWAPVWAFLNQRFIGCSICSTSPTWGSWRGHYALWVAGWRCRQ